jgi:hypothetical protein
MNRLLNFLISVSLLAICFNVSGQIWQATRGLDKNNILDKNGYHGLSQLDTVFFIDSNVICAIGKVALLNDTLKSDLRVGSWINYYPSGKISSIGIYQIEIYYICGTIRYTEYNNYKIGYWEYFYENGNIMASGIYAMHYKKAETNCGTVKLKLPYRDKTWTYYDDAGNVRTANDIMLID